MDAEQLEQGLNDIANEDTPIAQDYLNIDNLSNDFGKWYGDDRGIGEQLLAALRNNGVDTQAATEAMLREVLKDLLQDIDYINERLSGFRQELEKTSNKTEKVVDAITDTLQKNKKDTSNVSLDTDNVLDTSTLDGDLGGAEDMPPADTDEAEDMPPADMGGADMGGADMGGADMGGADMGGADMGGAEMPPADMGGAEMPPVEPTEPTSSDARIKHIRYIVSDENMKLINNSRKSKISTKLNPSFIDACSI